MIHVKETRIGCSGWSYNAWVGPFYPRGSKPTDYLKLYSRVFDTVEIDSTFYSAPSDIVVNNWFKNTPDGFIFCPKMQNDVTHKNKLKNVDIILEKFLESVKRLKSKLGMILIQLPPAFSFEDDMESLKEFLPLLPDKLEFAVEFRNNSMFTEPVYKLLEDYNITLAWSEIPMAKNPGVLTTDKVYLRLVGDRTIKESQFGKVQRNSDEEIEVWSGRVKKQRDDIEKVYIYSNNHFQGFGPATANIMYRKLGLEERKFTRIQDFIQSETGQRTLF